LPVVPICRNPTGNRLLLGTRRLRGLDERIGSSAIVERAYRAVQIIYLDQNKWIDLARA
jgi:hypothetical protein